jgi:Transposase zinc-binding domain/Putative transposase
MPTVVKVMRRYGGAYLERFGASMPVVHKKVLRAITACRTGELGLVLYRCDCCDQIQAMDRSCGDQHCPAWQRDKADAWLQTQTNRLLPCPYFLVTFTLPAELRDLARRHQRVVYSALFEASSKGLRVLAADPKYIRSDRLSFLGVLHTWGWTLEYHPHVHYVISGGGLSNSANRWLLSRADFLVPAKALLIVFRAKFHDILHGEGLLKLVNPMV